MQPTTKLIIIEQKNAFSMFEHLVSCG